MENINSTVIKGVTIIQQLFSLTLAIFWVVATAGWLVIQILAVKDPQALYNLLSAGLILLSMAVIAFSCIKNIMQARTLTLSIEYFAVVILLATTAHGYYLIALYENTDDVAVKVIMHYYQLEKAGDYSYLVQALQLAWQNILIATLFYGLQIVIHHRLKSGGK